MLFIIITISSQVSSVNCKKILHSYAKVCQFNYNKHCYYNFANMTYYFKWPKSYPGDVAGTQSLTIKTYTQIKGKHIYFTVYAFVVNILKAIIKLYSLYNIYTTIKCTTLQFKIIH